MQRTPPETLVEPLPRQVRDKESESRHVDVTVALAEAGYIFQMYSSDELGVYWEILFKMKNDERQLSVEIQSHGPWLTFIAEPGVGQPDNDLARALLNLNGRIATARAGFNPRGE